MPEARRRFAPMVRDLFDAFLAAHARLPGRRGRRPGRPGPARSFDGSPAGRRWPAVAGLADVVQRRAGRRRCGPTCCAAARRAVGHMRPDARGVRRPAATAARRRRDRHVLLLDDTYVSGARAQSAAAALRPAGAAQC